MRILRVFKVILIFLVNCEKFTPFLQLVKHFTGLQSLLSTLGQVYKEIFLLMVLISVCVLTLSSLIYFAEKGGKANWSFYQSFWWGLMCITTVGQGDNNPESTAGKVKPYSESVLSFNAVFLQIIGSFTALLGVFILALPVPLLLNS